MVTVEAEFLNLVRVTADLGVVATAMADVSVGSLRPFGLGCRSLAISLPPQGAPTMSESPQAVLPRRRRWRWVVVLFLGLLLGGAWFAPEIVSQTSLRHSVAAWATQGLPLKVELGATSLGWLRPVALRDLRVLDTDGQPLLEVKELRSEKSLWQLATQLSQLGTFTLVEPTGHVLMRADGSNVEDVVTALLSGPATEPSPEIRLDIVNARVEFEHPAAKRKSTLASVDVKVSSGPNGIESLIAEMPSKSAPPSAGSGRFAAYYGKPVAEPNAATTSTNAGAVNHQAADQEAERADSKTASNDTVQLLVRAKNWPVDWLNTALARWEPTGDVSGQLSADCRVSLGESISGKGTVAIQNLIVAGLSGMGSDRLTLSEVSLRGVVTQQGDRLVLDDAELRTEVGSLTATGNVPVTGWSLQSADEFLRKLGRETFRVEGEVDLAKLAALLPQTLAVREGTRIDGGSVSIALVSQPQDGREAFQGKAEIARLSAVADGRRFDWDVPLQALVVTHRDGNKFLFDRVTCRSDFLQADAQGTLTEATFQLRADLDRLHHNLSRFFDWGLVRLSGQLASNGQLHRGDNHEIKLRTKTELSNFECQRRGESPWREERLEIVAAASARLSEQQQLQSIDAASVRLVSGEDRLDVTLSEPLDWSSPNARWQAVADVVGGLDSWQARLRPVLTVDGWQLAGQITAHAEINSDARHTDVTKLSVGIDNLQARGPEWLIQEPKLTLETAGHWESVTSRWMSPQTTLTATSAAATVSNLDWSLDGANAGASGESRFRVHLGHVSHWKVQAQPQPGYFVAGEATGELRLQQRGATTTATLHALIEKLAVAEPANAGMPRPDAGSQRTDAGSVSHEWTTLWQEPEVKLVTQATFDSVKQSLRLNDTKLLANGLKLDLAGQVAELAATPIVDVSGEITYDWGQLTQRLGESLRRYVQLTGQERRQFTLRGRLAAPEVASSQRPHVATVSRTSAPSDSALSALSGEAGLGWQTANLYGMTAGAGDLSCKLVEGVGALALRDLPVNEGTVRLNSQLRLDRSPAMVVLQSERIIDKVRLSPELCAGWLKYVAPLMANATRVEGRFSVVLANGAFPVSDFSSGDIAGQLAVHQAQLSPGPFANQVISVVDRIKAFTKSRSLKPADLLSLAERSGTSASTGDDRVWVTLPEQEVPFRMTNGRVFHEGLTLVTKEATLKTRGSVGLDESLDLTVEIPLRDEWVAQNRSLSSLRGKTLQIPVRGSLSRPQLDARVLDSLARDALTAPLENRLETELQKGFNRLLPSKKK